MNHIDNSNKMVSDTPKTDESWMYDSDNLKTVGVDFARQLERELNAANDRVKSLIEERDRANRLAEWKWNLRDEFQLLLGTDKIEEGIEAVKELKRRIKRLEEALRCISNQDYRGNRSTESQIAFDALKEDKL